MQSDAQELGHVRAADRKMDSIFRGAERVAPPLFAVKDDEPGRLDLAFLAVNRRLQVRQECGEDAQRRQVRAKLVHEIDPLDVGNLTERGRTEAAEAEGKTEEETGDG